MSDTKAKVLALAFLLAGAVASLQGADGGSGGLEVAREALNDRLYEMADRHLVRFLAVNREDAPLATEALLMFCLSLAEQGRPKDIINILDSNRDIAEFSLDGGGFAFWRGWAMLETGQVKELPSYVAQLDFEAIKPGYALGLRRIEARAQARNANYVAASQLFETVSRMATNVAVRVENLVEWAQLELSTTNLVAAEGKLAEMMELAPDATNAMAARGRLLQAQLWRRSGRMEEAESMLWGLVSAEKADTASGWYLEAWLELAEIAAGRDDIENVRKAGDWIRKAEISNYKSWRVGLQYGRLLAAIPSEIGGGADLIKRCVRQYPEAPEAEKAQFALAEAWLAVSSNQQAVVEFQNYLETYGDYQRLLASLLGQAEALTRLGSHGEAASLYRKAAAATEVSEEALEYEQRAADAYHADGNYEEAVRFYRKGAGAKDAEVAFRARLMEADCLERMGRNAEAETVLSELAERDASPEMHDRTLLRLAVVRERDGRMSAAIEANERLLRDTTNELMRMSALLGKGRVYYSNYQLETALESLEKIKGSDDALRSEADYLKILALYGVGRDAEASSVAQYFTTNYVDSHLLADVSLWLAQYSYNRRDYDSAQERLVDFVARWPRHHQSDAALIWAGRAAIHRGEFSEAIGLLGRLPQEYQESDRLAEARLLQGDSLCEQARYEEAVMVFNEIINRYPESESVTAAWLRKGDSLYAMASGRAGRYEEALQAYEIVVRRPDATPETVLQAAFKKGRCLEKMQRLTEASDQYYVEVIMKYWRDQREGIRHGRASQTWYAWATLHAAALEENRGNPEAAIRLLRRLAESALKGSDDARLLIEQIKARQPVEWPDEEELSNEIK